MPSNIFELRIFKWIEKDVVEEIINNCRNKTFSNGVDIIKEWDDSNWEWYILLSWSVWISIEWAEIAELSEWDIFWEIALLNEEKRTATVTSLWDIEVIVLKIYDIMEMINSGDNKINKVIISRIEENLEHF